MMKTFNIRDLQFIGPPLGVLIGDWGARGGVLRWLNLDASEFPYSNGNLDKHT